MPTVTFCSNSSVQNGANAGNAPDFPGPSDVFLMRSNPDQNQQIARRTELRIGKFDGSFQENVLVRWDLSVLPANITVTDAKIWFKVTSGGGVTPQTFSAYRSIRPWVVDEATWNSYAAGQPWSTPGGGEGDPNDIVTDLSGTSDNVTTANTWSNPPFTGAGIVADLQAWLDGTENNGWLFTYTGAPDGRFMTWYSNEQSGVTNRPELEITYEDTVLGPVIEDVNTDDTVRDLSTDNQINGSELQNMNAVYLVDTKGNEIAATNIRPQ